jgi:hypothetical protein
MDWAETIRKMVLAAGVAGEIPVDRFKELTPLGLSAEELERLIDALNAEGVWIIEE